MPEFIGRYPKNIAGKFYTDSNCSDCDLCRETSPNNFKRDDELGMSYVYRQPTTPEEVTLCEEAKFGCPMDAIGNDGDLNDWQSSPIRDWARISDKMRPLLEGLNVLSPEEESKMPKTFHLW